MSMKRPLGGTAIEAQMHSFHSECKNVQKYVLTNVNMKRNTSPYFLMFAFGGRQRHLQILANFLSRRRLSA